MAPWELERAMRDDQDITDWVQRGLQFMTLEAVEVKIRAPGGKRG